MEVFTCLVIQMSDMVFTAQGMTVCVGNGANDARLIRSRGHAVENVEVFWKMFSKHFYFYSDIISFLQLTLGLDLQVSRFSYTITSSDLMKVLEIQRRLFSNASEHLFVCSKYFLTSYSFTSLRSSNVFAPTLYPLGLTAPPVVLCLHIPTPV